MRVWKLTVILCKTGTFYCFCFQEVPWLYHLSSPESTARFPQHVPGSITELILRCIAYEHQDRPTAEFLFQTALKNLNDADRALASAETFHAMSDSALPATVHPAPGNPRNEPAPMGPNPPTQVNTPTTRSRSSVNRAPAADPISRVYPASSTEAASNLDSTTAPPSTTLEAALHQTPSPIQIRRGPPETTSILRLKRGLHKKSGPHNRLHNRPELPKRQGLHRR